MKNSAIAHRIASPTLQHHIERSRIATPQTFDYYCQLLKNQHGLNGVEAAKVAAQNH